ncbi:hypothetical protein Pflav_047520 [Phytohabitans flavus]|uniref:Uncharacterized protein n=1 Tax=Phytohabitans flavus TaxID=1076124 RepID=A0A6F8XWV7_9ACTN|nr:hypothetical protein Pflav_047520 [Phytohabitans flavus]
MSASRSDDATGPAAIAARLPVDALIEEAAVGHVCDQACCPRVDLFEFQWRDAVEDPRGGAECEWRDVQAQLVDEASGKVLVDGGRAAHDCDVAVAGGFGCRPTSRSTGGPSRRARARTCCGP